MGIILSSTPVFAQNDGMDEVIQIPINEVIQLVDEYGNPINPISGEGEDYKNNQPIVDTTRPIRLFPSHVEEIDLGEHRRILRTYALSPYEDPMDIDMTSFERDGFYFTLQDITRNRTQYVSTQDYVKVVEIETSQNTVNAIMEHLNDYIDYETYYGYSGRLFLELGSIDTQISGIRQESFTQTEHRTFPNLSNPDVSLIPQTITVGGRTLTLQNVSWSSASEHTVDYTRLASTFTANAVYTRQGVRNVTLGYITTAEFRGQLSRVNEGETTYIAMFSGVVLNPEPIIAGIPYDDYSYENYDIYNHQESERESRSMNWAVLLGALGILSALGATGWFFFIRGNVEVYNLDNSVDGQYVKIGRAKVSKGNPVISLVQFSDKAKTSAFKLDIAGWTASGLNGQTITVNYTGSPGTWEYEVVYTKGQGKYEIEMSF